MRTSHVTRVGRLLRGTEAVVSAVLLVAVAIGVTALAQGRGEAAPPPSPGTAAAAASLGAGQSLAAPATTPESSVHPIATPPAELPSPSPTTPPAVTSIPDPTPTERPTPPPTKRPSTPTPPPVPDPNPEPTPRIRTATVAFGQSRALEGITAYLSPREPSQTPICGTSDDPEMQGFTEAVSYDLRITWTDPSDANEPWIAVGKTPYNTLWFEPEGRSFKSGADYVFSTCKRPADSSSAMIEVQTPHNDPPRIYRWYFK